MQELTLEITIQYRSDGPVNKSQVHAAMCDLLLTRNRERLFRSTATYAGYSIAIQPPKKRKLKAK